MAALDPSIQLADADVFHARLRPDGVRFRYCVLAVMVDLDRLDEPPAIPFFSLGRWNLFGFYPADHGAHDGSDLRGAIDRMHQAAGLSRPHRVVLTCFPRILGYVFNPIATYCCSDVVGRTTSIAYEVRNTFGERHTYLCPVKESADGTVLPHECDKLFYVSPFMDMPLRYRFLTSPPRDGAFSLKIIERDTKGSVLTALMQVRAFRPTRTAVLRRLLSTPLAGFKVVAAIHWQALRLWRKGHHVRPKPAPPAPVSMDGPGAFSLTASPISGSPHA